MSYQSTINGKINTRQNPVNAAFKSLEKTCAETYRFGFNGQELDNEVTGVIGSHYTAEFWEYDSRLGRRWNLDPKPQISISDYACFGNNPIVNIDKLGDEWDESNDSKGKADSYRASATNEIEAIQKDIASVTEKRNLYKEGTRYWFSPLINWTEITILN